MSVRFTRLRLEELGARTLPSATLLPALTPSPTVHVASVATAAKFAISAPTTTAAGVNFRFTVTALDQFGNKVTGYTGTVHFTSTDGTAILPGNAKLTNGTGSFSAILEQAGSQTVLATDTVNASISGIAGGITVAPAAAAKFGISAPATTAAGAPLSFTVTALDPFGNKVTNFTGGVHFTSSDGAALLPANGRIVNGTGTFSATLKTPGSQTIGATNTANFFFYGSSGPITVTPAPAPTGTGQGKLFTPPTSFGQPTVYGLVGTAQVAGGRLHDNRHADRSGVGSAGPTDRPADVLQRQRLLRPSVRWGEPIRFFPTAELFQYQLVNGSGLFQQTTGHGTIRLGLTFGAKAGFSLSF